MNWTLHCGSALDVLAQMPESSVHCVVTSPPYWGLRDYGHEGQIGLEASPTEFVTSLVAVFAEVKRVLRPDGVLWLNMGDTYFGDSPVRTSAAEAFSAAWNPELTRSRGGSRRSATSQEGLKQKDLCGMPWRVAFALQDDGWYLRSDVIWAKPNPMPESVTDRPTKSHEYVFLLTKSAKYWYDQDAIREPYVRLWDETAGGGMAKPNEDAARAGQVGQAGAHRGAYPMPKRETYTGQATKDYAGAGVQDPSDTKRRVLASMEQYAGSNARTVWTLPKEPSPLEHFAVMPKALARKCIWAGCPFDGVVLDPFAGVATTGVVALEEGRSFIGIELNPTYHATGRVRLAGVSPLLATEAPPVSAQGELFTGAEEQP